MVVSSLYCARSSDGAGVFVGAGVSVGGTSVSVTAGIVVVGTGASVGCAEEHADTTRRINSKARVVLF